MKNLYLIILGLAISQIALAQKPKYGIKAALNVSTILGNVERDGSGNALEKYIPQTGFSVGATAMFPITDIFGAEGELLYAIKSTRYEYNGPGYYNFVGANNSVKHVEGNLRFISNRSNNYIDVPLMLYYKPAKHFKVNLGVHAAVNVGSTGAGEFKLSEIDYIDGTGDKTRVKENIIIALTEDFSKAYDKQLDLSSPNSLTVPSVSFRGDTYVYPSIVGAYYFYPDKRGTFFNMFDAGIVGGASYVFGSGLNIGLRANYGLLDLTTDYYQNYRSINTGKADGYKPVNRGGFNRDLTFQVHIGFSF